MALKITIPTRYGIDATYFKVVDLNINWLTRQSHVTLCGWKDEEARRNNQQPLTERSFDWSGDDFPFLDEEPQNEREIAYISIKNPVTTSETNEEIPSEFSQAVDC